MFLFGLNSLLNQKHDVWESLKNFIYFCLFPSSAQVNLQKQRKRKKKIKSKSKVGTAIWEGEGFFNLHKIASQHWREDDFNGAFLSSSFVSSPQINSGEKISKMHQRENVSGEENWTAIYHFKGFL